MKNKIVLFLILLLILTGIFIYKNRIQNITNTPNQESLASEDTVIEDYLNSNILKPEFGGKVFCVFKKYGSEEKDYQAFYYLWVYCEEYYKKGDDVLMGSGVSVPVKLNALKKENEIIIENFTQPIDGEGYSESIKNMFPEKYANKAIDGLNINKFLESPKEKALSFYKNHW